MSFLCCYFSVALGYLRLFPSKSVNAWSSGTGMAGILGSAIYIIFGNFVCHLSSWGLCVNVILYWPKSLEFCYAFTYMRIYHILYMRALFLNKMCDLTKYGMNHFEFSKFWLNRAFLIKIFQCFSVLILI